MGLPWRACRHLPIEREMERRGPLPSLSMMLTHRRSMRVCSAVFRIPRSHSLSFVSWWPLSRKRNQEAVAADHRAAARIRASRAA